jgi:hypothetical protein
VESHGYDHGCVDQVATNFQPFWASKEDGAHIVGRQFKGHQVVGEHVGIYVL